MCVVFTGKLAVKKITKKGSGTLKGSRVFKHRLAPYHLVFRYEREGGVVRVHISDRLGGSICTI